MLAFLSSSQKFYHLLRLSRWVIRGHLLKTITTLHYIFVAFGEADYQFCCRTFIQNFENSQRSFESLIYSKQYIQLDRFIYPSSGLQIIISVYKQVHINFLTPTMQLFSLMMILLLMTNWIEQFVTWATNFISSLAIKLCFQLDILVNNGFDLSYQVHIIYSWHLWILMACFKIH